MGEDLGQLAEAVTGFRAEASWLEAEAMAKLNGGYVYDNEEVRERMLAIHRDELVWRSEALEIAWTSAQTELVAVLAFFAESSPEKSSLWEKGRSEKDAERLFRTVDDFQIEMQRVADQVASQPQR